MLVGLAREGDKDAFQELVIRRQSRLRALLRRMCGNPSLADDLAQQAFIIAYKKIQSLRVEAAFAGWLRQIAVNVWLQHCRRSEGNQETGRVKDKPTEPTSKADDSSLGIDLKRALQSLSVIERTCVILSYQEGLSHNEISHSTDLPLGTVKSHINRGTKKLQTNLTAYRKVEDK